MLHFDGKCGPRNDIHACDMMQNSLQPMCYKIVIWRLSQFVATQSLQMPTLFCKLQGCVPPCRKMMITRLLLWPHWRQCSSMKIMWSGLWEDGSVHDEMSGWRNNMGVKPCGGCNGWVIDAEQEWDITSWSRSLLLTMSYLSSKSKDHIIQIHYLSSFLHSSSMREAAPGFAELVGLDEALVL